MVLINGIKITVLEKNAKVYKKYINIIYNI